MASGLLGAAGDDEEAAVQAAYDAGDLGALLARCPSVDGLIEVIVRGATPRTEEREEAIDAWNAFVGLAWTLRERRRQACDD